MNSRVVPAAAPVFFKPSPFAASSLRQAITAACRMPEPDAVAAVMPAARVPAAAAARIESLALRLTAGLRARKGSGRAGLVQNLLQQYALSSQEGVALMCLAEALLRIPDAATRDRLIRDKITQGEWRTHLGRSPSLFVNAATWGLLITGKLVATHSESGLSSAMGRLIATGGEPLVRKGVDMAMRMMGEQFVTGETIAEALQNSAGREKEGFRHSFDMLGEAAMTAADAGRYLRDYEQAIDAIGAAAAGRGIHAGPGISIKLSALHPRYARSQYERVMAELYPVLLRLCARARDHDIGLNIDAEEADRLELSLDLLERLAFEPLLEGWNGLGFVVQAYQKRCPFVLDHLIDLAARSRRRLMVRLVKGAYWDSEIKRAQLDGLDDYPVYTRKPHTDAAYIAAARKLLAAPREVYPQFATHNAQTLASIYELAQPDLYTADQYEFQCLHGMGEPLYEQVVGDPADGKLGRHCRIYAPVGTHETLLAYLVRRLLENGANTSFVNQVADPAIAAEGLVRDPVAVIDACARTEGAPGLPHPAIPLPRDLYGQVRPNSRGIDLSSEAQLHALAAAFAGAPEDRWEASPLLAKDRPPAERLTVNNPANRADRVGGVSAATPADVELALQQAVAAAPRWAAVAPTDRAQRLESAADRLEAELPRLVTLLVREAGKTAAAAVAEVREAVDFLRYYASEAGTHLDNTTHLPLGPVVCISPWNFPLAIFMGQVAAALAAGNVVLAKPAEQTPLIAAQAVRTLWAAGVPREAVQLLPGPGAEVGARLVADARTQGVLFTGSTAVARTLQRSLVGRVTASGRAVPLVAETGGQNAMIVDSSALAEQVVADVLASSFDSAGQRCSALRVLCVQEEAAGPVLAMLLGAMAELRVGDPARLATDVGPLIDEQARGRIERHVAGMRAAGRRVSVAPGALPEGGSYVLPTLIQIGSLSELQQEVFGPVLHFLRFKREELDGLLHQINATGYGLTLGLHTRIDETIAQVVATARAGNVYVNRNMVGAVVGVQPFGGAGLSGTGPKAGGPLYLFRLLARCPGDVPARVFDTGAEAAPASAVAAAPAPAMALERASAAAAPAPLPALAALVQWLHPRDPGLAAVCSGLGARARPGASLLLPGPTGERNVYRLVPRTAVLCLADADADRLVQLAAVLAVGGRAVWPATSQALLRQLPEPVRSEVALSVDAAATDTPCDAVLLHGSIEALVGVQQVLARRDGPVVGVERLAPGETDVPLERLVVERTISTNTAAAGGNASLMTIG